MFTSNALRKLWKWNTRPRGGALLNRQDALLGIIGNEGTMDRPAWQRRGEFNTKPISVLRRDERRA
jgi:hypothetical protein